jgi:23S rRNA pseudouridine1911/1915/1917 synthase
MSETQSSLELDADSQVIHLQVDQATPRLDQFLVHHLSNLSRSFIKKLIQQERVLLNKGEPVRPSQALSIGDTITIHLPIEQPDFLTPEPMPLDIVYEDEALVVINKSAGLVVHPAQGHSGGTLVNALLARYPDLMSMSRVNDEASDRPGIVHRLDRDTSGLIIVARTPPALAHLQRQFKARTVEKIYLALVFGIPPAPEGIIDVPLGRDSRQRQKMTPRSDGKMARTHYRLREAFTGYSLLEIGLETGRTHQIRVHLAWLKCPVVGDTIYGRRKNPLGLKRQFLHAWRLHFTHPATEQPMMLEAPLPPDLQLVLQNLT